MMHTPGSFTNSLDYIMIFGVLALAGYFIRWLWERNEEKNARTAEEKKRVVMRKLTRKAAEDGHKNPERVAIEQFYAVMEMESFSRQARDAYVNNDTDLEDSKKEWVKRMATIPGRDSRINLAIDSLTDEEVFDQGPSKEKNEKEWERIMGYKPPRDPVEDHVIDQLFSGRRTI